MIFSRRQIPGCLLTLGNLSDPQRSGLVTPERNVFHPKPGRKTLVCTSLQLFMELQHLALKLQCSIGKVFHFRLVTG